TEFYTDYGVRLQKQFFGKYLKGEDNGWEKRRPLQLRVRTVDGFQDREEREWPLPGTRWDRLHLDTSEPSLRAMPAATACQASFSAMKDELHFRLAEFAEPTEITGPLALKLFVSSSTADADIFATVRAFRPDGKEHLFASAVDPNAPVAQG